ncbi:MAG: DUF222 domain-containing protein [Candidatus Dormibacterales bacterium]
MSAQSVSVLRAKPLSNRDLAAELIRFRHQIDLMELRFSVLCAEFAGTDEYEAEGSTSPIDWIRFNCAMTGNAADRVAVGEQSTKLGQSLQAVVDGKIGFAHLTVLARTSAALGDRFEERALLVQASDHSPGKFHHLCLHYRHAADPQSYAEERAEQVHQRRLSMSTWEDGSLLLSGVLDPVGGAVVRSALAPLARRSGAQDDRELEQRQADALVELAGGRNVTQLQVTSSVETLLGLVGAPGAEMEFSLPVSSRTVERLACDCSLTRVLLGAESSVIEVGRARRVVSGPARRALVARDRHCVWPGSERPASWSGAHHVVHWVQGGSTDLENLVLLCHRHHWLVHEGRWQLVKDDAGRRLAIPPTVNFGAPARGPD